MQEEYLPLAVCSAVRWCRRRRSPLHREERNGSLETSRLRSQRLACRLSNPPSAQAIEIEVHHRSGEQCQRLADDQAADNRDAERTPELRACPCRERQRKRAKESCRRSHKN